MDFFQSKGSLFKLAIILSMKNYSGNTNFEVPKVLSVNAMVRYIFKK